jgi:tetratricopeptide (TPR) repeat protein
MNKLPLHTVTRIGWTLLATACLVSGAAADGQPAKPPAAAPTKPASAQQIDKLIRQLGDKDYYVRQHAQDELARLGFDAFDAISAATTDEDLEIASRAKYLLRLMRVEWIDPSDSPRVKRCLRNYENPENADARREIMQVLAGLPDGEGVAALCRLVRYEKSPLLSKTAAVVLLTHRSTAAAPTSAEIEAVHKVLRGCKRPGAVWLSAWSRLGSEPAAAMSLWPGLIAGEQALLRRTPNETSPEIVADLIRFQVAWLKKLGDTEAAATAVRRLVDEERGDLESLARLIPWLVEQKAWKPIDELAKRFESRCSGEPLLLYLLAEAYAAQGAKDRAEKTASQALGSFPGKQEESLYRHFGMARQLQVRGLFAWSRREYEYVIGKGRDADALSVGARTTLAEMLHDQGQDLDAASTLEKLVSAIDAHKVSEAQLERNGRGAKAIRALTYYFFACHWEARGDAAKQRAYLDKALAADPEDVDVLIALYRLPGQPPAHRAKIVDSIKRAAATIHKEIDEDPDTPSPCNQYAWLIGNTEGDMDEALRCSLKSLELQPEEAAYLDTLGHVYFGRGDFANAVKYQAKAVEHEPHSGIIRRELERFRKKLDETKAAKPH